MENLDALRNALHPAVKDVKLNIQAVLRADKLTAYQCWGCALASAYFLKDLDLAAAVLDDAKSAGVPEAVVDDAKAAAAIMAMNTVYYRFRHMIAHVKDKYGSMNPQLRMSRMAQVASDKATFELMSMSCAALAGCEMCIVSHEKSILDHGLAEEHVHDAVRIAAVIHGFSVSMTLG
jgi:alkyl hydroperoxide reductase subunit D